MSGTEEDELVAMESLDIDVLVKLTAGEDKIDLKISEDYLTHCNQY